MFVLLIKAFIILMLLGYVTFDQGHWWDLTLAVAIPLEIIAFFMSIKAVRKMHERSILVKLSVFIGACMILFLFTHSLFIHD
jgi:hypothetical protein